MDFEVVGDITGVETIASVPAFASVVACANDMVSAVGASEKVSPKSGSRQANSFASSLHWYEATGIGKREMKIKAFL